MSDSYIRDRGTRGTLEAIYLSSLSWSDGSTPGLSLRSSDHVVGRLLTLLRMGQSRLLTMMSRHPQSRTWCRTCQCHGRGTVSDASHPPLRCEPTMTIPRTFTSYVSGYGESAVPTLSASERSSIDVSERTLHLSRSISGGDL